MSANVKAGALRDPERLRALRATELLDALPQAAFDRLTRLATRAVGVEVALVSLVDEDRQYNLSSSTELAPQGANSPLADSFCSVVVRRGAPFITEDIASDAVGEEHPGLRESPARAYAGFPLIVDGDKALGALCAIDFEPRVWSESELETLRDIATMVVDEIKLRETLRLAELRRDELERAAASIRTLHGALDAADVERVEGRQAGLRVAADLAHELRTPLYAIRNLAEDIGGVDAGVLRDGPQQIGQATADALAVIDHHLELARATSGQGVVRVHDVRVPEFFRALRGMLEPLVRRAEVTLRFVEPGTLPVLCTDGVKLAQILRNLTTNALRHTVEGEIVVTAEAGAGATVLFHVCDTGCGIAPEDQERIFGRGEQLGAESSSGAGLGLPLARRMAEMIGGEIRLESTLGEGSCFTVCVPLAVRDTKPGVTVTSAPY